MESQWISNGQTNLKKETKLENSYFLTLKLNYKVTITKTVWFWHKDRQYRQYNGTDRIRALQKYTLTYVVK